MKNKKLQGALSKLLKIDEKVIEAASENEAGDDIIIKEYNEQHKVFSLSELKTLIENSNKSYLETVDFNNVEVPTSLFEKVKALSFKRFEKSFAAKHGIDSYSSLEDLIQKTIDKSNNGKGKPDEDLLNQIEVLKQAVQDKEQALKDFEAKVADDYIKSEFNSALEKLPLDYDTDTLPKQRELLSSAFLSKHKVIKKADKTIVLDLDGKPVLDKLADPAKIADVVQSFANGYGFKFKEADKGGRGGSSSENTSINNYKGKTWEQVMKEKQLTPNSDASDKEYVLWKAENKTT